MAYNWNPIKTIDFKRKAYAYYRHSAEDRQQNSIPLQQEQVRDFASRHGIEIVREFQDAGVSGLTDKREGFQKLIYNVRAELDKVDFILVLDVSRWGRFQDVDQGAMYSWECKKHNVRILYINRDDPESDGLDLKDSLLLNVERNMAAIYSKNLSEKVFKGCRKVAQQGFRAGAPAPYGLKRILLDESRNYVQDLKPGQHKSIHNQRVTLAPGHPSEVKVIKEIFRKFVVHKKSCQAIALNLNKRNIPSPSGKKWNSGMVIERLQNPLYSGTMVYNKIRSRLKSPSRKNPKNEWVVIPDAFESIVDKKTFEKAQEKITLKKEEEARKFSIENMSHRLATLLEKYGYISSKIINNADDTVSAYSYRKYFGSLENAYQYLYQDHLDKCKKETINKISLMNVDVDDFGDFIVIDNYSSIQIQPKILKPNCYEASWNFAPLKKSNIDITLGVLLTTDGEMIGYLVFFNKILGSKNVNLSTYRLADFDLYTYSLTEIISLLRKKEVLEK